MVETRAIRRPKRPLHDERRGAVYDVAMSERFVIRICTLKISICTLERLVSPRLRLVPVHLRLVSVHLSDSSRHTLEMCLATL